MITQQRLRLTNEDVEEYDPLQLYRELEGRMTQEQYCRALGISEKNFIAWWRGKRSPTFAVWFLRAGTLRRDWMARGWIN